jgi:NAD(P)-dependent dehydrogenase (short-subunit alcohol dehydrogenase family)
MDLGLETDVAVVVGAARGIGRAIAAAFLAEGASVALVDRDPSVVEASRDLATAGRTAPHVADATDFPAMRAAAHEVVNRFGRCDHVVYAAAVGSGKFGMPFWNLDPVDWELVIRVNLLGAVNVAHAFAPSMAQVRRGTILLVASVAGQIGSPTDPPYSASKAALINFAQCAARDLAAFGVRVNALCPGMVDTPLNRSVHAAWNALQPEGSRTTFEAWTADKIRRLVPLNRWQRPEDIAAMAVFLASPRAGEVTGQTINVDGGYVMHS